MKAHFVTVASELKEWDTLKRHIADFCENYRFSQELLLSLQLVCEEWYINIVVHGYQNASREELTSTDIKFNISYNQQDSVIKVYFIDCAPAFNPLLQVAPDVTLSAEEREVGGLGIYLINSMMDTCEYHRIDGCNHLILYKYVTV